MFARLAFSSTLRQYFRALSENVRAVTLIRGLFLEVETQAVIQMKITVQYYPHNFTNGEIERTDMTSARP